MAGGDEFVEFMRTASARLLRAGYLLTGDRLLTGDAVQTAFVRAHATWPRVRRVRRQDAYAYIGPSWSTTSPMAGAVR